MTFFDRLQIDGLHAARCLQVCRAWRRQILRVERLMKLVDGHVVFYGPEGYQGTAHMCHAWNKRVLFPDNRVVRYTRNRKVEDMLERMLLEQHMFQYRFAAQPHRNCVITLAIYDAICRYRHARDFLHVAGEDVLMVIHSREEVKCRELEKEVFPGTLMWRVCQMPNGDCKSFVLYFRRWSRKELKEKWAGSNEVLGMREGERTKLYHRRVRQEDEPSESERAWKRLCSI